MFRASAFGKLVYTCLSGCQLHDSSPVIRMENDTSCNVTWPQITMAFRGIHGAALGHQNSEVSVPSPLLTILYYYLRDLHWNNAWNNNSDPAVLMGPITSILRLNSISRELPEKNSLLPRGAVRTIFGSELLVRNPSVNYWCLGAVLPTSWHHCLGSIPRKVTEKFSSSQGRVYKKFSGANFWFDALLSIICVLVLLCLHRANIIWIVAPESGPKNFLPPRARWTNNFRERTFGSRRFQKPVPGQTKKRTAFPPSFTQTTIQIPFCQPSGVFKEQLLTAKFHSRNTKFHSRDGIPQLEQYNPWNLTNPMSEHAPQNRPKRTP